jgi:hypothetical protein
VSPAVDLLLPVPVRPAEKPQSFRDCHLSFPFELTYSAAEPLLPIHIGKQRSCHLCGCLSPGPLLPDVQSEEAGYAE